MSNTNASLQAAGAWFLNSGIQEESGGVARYYRSDTSTNARVSTEITGYAVSALLFLHERTGEAEYLDAALRSARFLTRTAWDTGLRTFPFECALNGNYGQAPAYFFDCGIIVRGLINAWRVSNEVEYRDVAIAAGRAMLADFRAGDNIHPILALPGKRPMAYGTSWSTSPGCYQLKAALAWQDLFEATGEKIFCEAYERAVEGAVASEHAFLPGELDREKVMDRLHAYLYFLEGLLPVVERADYRGVFQRGLDRVSGYLREIAPVFVRSDVYAQLLRVRLYSERLAGIPLDFAAALNEANEAASFQTTSSDSRVAGGFVFGRKGGDTLPFVNPVSTAFCVQALTFWEDRGNNRFEAQRHALI